MAKKQRDAAATQAPPTAAEPAPPQRPPDVEVALYQLCPEGDDAATTVALFLVDNKLVELPGYEPQPVPEGYDPDAADRPVLTHGQFFAYIQEKHGLMARLYHLTTKVGSRVVLLARGQGAWWFADVTDVLKTLRPDPEVVAAGAS